MDRNSKNRNLSKDIAGMIVNLEADDPDGATEIGAAWYANSHVLAVLKGALSLTGFGPGGPDELDMLEATHAEV